MFTSSPQDVSEYRENLLAQIQNDFEIEGTPAEEAFAFKASEELINAEIIDEYNPAYFDYENDGIIASCHLNGYSFSNADNFMNLFVSLYYGDEQIQKIGVAEIRDIFHKAMNFVRFRNAIQNMSNEASDHLDCIQLIGKDIGTNEDSVRRFRIFIFTDAQVSIQAKKIKPEVVENVPVEPLIYDIDTLHELSLPQEGNGTLAIDFEKYNPWKIHCVKASTSDNTRQCSYDSYIGVMPGTLLADIYDEFGARLLEGNVRSFLSSKGAVNKKIRETLLRKPDQFFAFNNGISVTASNVKFDDNHDLIYAEEFQIINGGQTTASISNTRFCDKTKLDLEKVNVLMKLTVIDESMNENDKMDLLASISRASNQQNKVSDADFFSTHPFHIAIEEWSRITPAPSLASTLQSRTYWFYERARGQYNQKQMKLSKSQKLQFKKEYPQKQKITKTDLAKYRNSWDEKPYSVSKGAQANFQDFAQSISSLWEKGDAYRSEINQKYFKDSVSIAIIFNKIGEIVSSQEWYTGSFRANIVTYTLSLFHHFLVTQYPKESLNLDEIWKRQCIPSVLDDIFTDLTKLTYDEIINQREGIVNYTQRCKKKSFWEKMMNQISFSLDNYPDLKKYMISKTEKKMEEKQAKDFGKLLFGVQLQTWVIEKKPEFWSKVKEFAMNDSHTRLSMKEESALTSAINGRVPPEFVCKTLQQLLRRCEENGFNED